jgi:hypothetical protein
MCQPHVLVAPSVEYESIQEFTSSCEGLLHTYHSVMCDALTRTWLKRNTTPPSSYDRHLLCISSFEDVLGRGAEYIQRTTRGQGGLYAHSMNMEIVREMNMTNHVYFYTLYVHKLEDLLRTIYFALRRIVLDGSQSHFARIFRENFVCFRDGDTPWLICPVHKVDVYKTALLMSQHRRLGGASALHTLPVDILDMLLRACYTAQ